MYYKVGLYKYYNEPCEYEYIQDIIVEKKLFFTREIYTNINIPSVKFLDKNNLAEKSLFIQESQLVHSNLVNSHTISEYISNFDLDKFNKILNMSRKKLVFQKNKIKGR